MDFGVHGVPALRKADNPRTTLVRCVGVVFADEALLDQTIEQYIAAVELGEMTDAKAMEVLPRWRWDC